MRCGINAYRTAGEHTDTNFCKLTGQLKCRLFTGGRGLTRSDDAHPRTEGQFTPNKHAWGNAPQQAQGSESSARL